MIPQSQPYVRNFLDNRDQLRGMGNSVRVVVENTQGDIFDPQYEAVLRQINDELFLTHGVDRAWLKSLWTPAVSWTAVNEEGVVGVAVMQADYDGSAKMTETLHANIARSAAAPHRFAINKKGRAPSRERACPPV